MWLSSLRVRKCVALPGSQAVLGKRPASVRCAFLSALFCVDTCSIGPLSEGQFAPGSLRLNTAVTEMPPPWCAASWKGLQPAGLPQHSPNPGLDEHATQRTQEIRSPGARGGRTNTALPTDHLSPNTHTHRGLCSDVHAPNAQTRPPLQTFVLLTFPQLCLGSLALSAFPEQGNGRDGYF